MQDSKLPSERSFGFLFAAVFAILAADGLYKNWNESTTSLLAATSIILLVVTLVHAQSLAPLNKAWFGLGAFLGKIVSPIVLGLIFFILITPVAVITRLLGRDVLRLKAKSAGTYWIERMPPGPAADSFKNQF